MNSAERDAFGQAVRAYLLENPEVIMEAVAVLEQRQAAAEAARDDALVETYLAELQNDGYSWVGGNPDGDHYRGGVHGLPLRLLPTGCA